MAAGKAGAVTVPATADRSCSRKRCHDSDQDQANRGAGLAQKHFHDCHLNKEVLCT
jgi:hypothetical protein